MDVLFLIVLGALAAWAWGVLIYFLVVEPLRFRRFRFDPQDRERVGLDSDRERWDAICERAEYERRRRQSHRQRRKAA